MTTDEAKKKWCPMARCTCENISGNRLWSDALAGQDPHCIADECACWVWDRTTEHNYGPVKHLPMEKWQGHCGLAR